MVILTFFPDDKFIVDFKEKSEVFNTFFENCVHYLTTEVTLAFFFANQQKYFRFSIHIR